MIDPLALICLLCITALLAGASVKHIPEGHVYTLHRLGRPRPRLLTPGTHLVVPLLERVRHKISLGGHTLPLEPAGDAEPVLRGVVYWQVLDPERADAVIDDAEALIRAGVLNAMTDACGDDDTEATRNQLIKRVLNDELRERGMLITRVDLRLS